MHSPIARTLSTLLLCIAALAAWAAPADDARIERLMRQSGLWTQMGALQQHVRTGAAAARERTRISPHPMDDADFARLLALTDMAFAPDRMRKATASGLREALGEAEVDALLAFLSSDLGRRFTAAEEAVAEVDATKSAEQAKALVEAMPTARRAMLQRLVQTVHADEMSADILINMSTAILYGVAASLPEGDGDAMLERAKRDARAQRPKLVAFFRNFMLLQAAYTYRELPDEDLERYLAFCESSVARHFNEASAHAVDHAIVQASLQLGRAMADDFARNRRRPA